MKFGIWCQPKDGSQNGGWLYDGGGKHITYAVLARAKSACWGSPYWTYQVREYPKAQS